MDSLIFEKKLCQYYNAYRKLRNLHKQLFNKSHAVDVPQKYSECLCKYVLELENPKSSKFDAYKNGLNYEIKATCEPNRNTTFSSTKPDKLIWLRFESSDQIMISEINDISFYDKFKDPNKRFSKYLSKKKCKPIWKITFVKNKLVKVAVSVNK